MAEPSTSHGSAKHDPAALKARYKVFVVRGLVATVVLAVLSVAEYILAQEVADPTWFLVPFMVAKALVILDVFMHVRHATSDGAH